MAARGAPRSHYSVLGCSRDADLAALRKRYQALALANHPDRRHDGRATNDEFKAVQEAWETLRDPERRAAYDAIYDVALANTPRTGSGGGERAAVADPKVWMELSLAEMTPGVGEDKGLWTYACRCGEVYEVSEEDVEEHLEFIPCCGCSLQIRLLEPSGEDGGQEGRGGVSRGDHILLDPAFEAQLEKAAMPLDLRAKVHHQLSTDTFCAGQHVVLSHHVVGEHGAADAADASAHGGGGTAGKSTLLTAIAKVDLSVGVLFLVDHAYSFLSAAEALHALREVPSLRQRVRGIVGVAPEASVSPEQLLLMLVPFVHTYEMEAPPPRGKLNVFYIMDEVGSRLVPITAASDGPPNCRMCTVEFAKEGQSESLAYNAVWLTSRIGEGQPLRWVWSDETYGGGGTMAADLEQQLAALGISYSFFTSAMMPPQPPVIMGAASATPEKAIPVANSPPIRVRIGLCESYTQKFKHSSLIYQPSSYMKVRAPEGLPDHLRSHAPPPPLSSGAKTFARATIHQPKPLPTGSH